MANAVPSDVWWCIYVRWQKISCFNSQKNQKYLKLKNAQNVSCDMNLMFMFGEELAFGDEG